MRNDRKVIIIGGGMIGCLTALYLQRLGAKPLVLEKGSLGRESSWAGAGILCPIHPWLYPDSFTHLINASLALYPAVSEMLADVSGISIEWRKCGLMIPMFDDDSIHHREHALRWSKRFGWKVEELASKECRHYEPSLSQNVGSGLLWPEVGQVRNPRMLTAIRHALAHAGVEVREHAEVVGLHHDRSDGAVSSVRLASGEQIAADTVLLAAGSWSGELASEIGLSLPIEPVKGQIALLKGEPGQLHHIIKHDDVYLVPRSDGHILVGASMERAGFQREINSHITQKLMDATLRIAPGLKDLPIIQSWMGFRPGTPDGLPYLGSVPEHPGVWVASGHYRNGVALAPITADIMSRWMMGEKPTLNMDDFRVDREVHHAEGVGLPK